MAGGDRMFRPREKGIRNPTSDQQETGQIVNPPRYAKIGGFISAAKGYIRNKMGIKKPGGGK